MMSTLAGNVPKEDLAKLDAISARRFGVGRSALIREALALLFEADAVKQRHEEEWAARMRGETVIETVSENA